MTTKTTTYLRVPGLNAALRKLPKESQKRLADEAKVIAGLIASEAASRASGLDGVAKRVAPSIKSRKDKRPTVAYGGTRKLKSGGTVGQVAAGAEFGSKKYKQFQPWRGNGQDAGYFLWPTVRENEDDYVERYADALDRALKDI